MSQDEKGPRSDETQSLDEFLFGASRQPSAPGPRSEDAEGHRLQDEPVQGDGLVGPLRGLGIGVLAVLMLWGLYWALGPVVPMACFLVGGLGWALGTSSPESKSVMFGVLGALLIQSALSYAAWVAHLRYIARGIERAFNQ